MEKGKEGRRVRQGGTVERGREGRRGERGVS